MPRPVTTKAVGVKSCYVEVSKRSLVNLNCILHFQTYCKCLADRHSMTSFSAWMTTQGKTTTSTQKMSSRLEQLFLAACDFSDIRLHFTTRQKKSPKLNYIVHHTLHYRFGAIKECFKVIGVPVEDFSKALDQIYDQLKGTCFRQFEELLDQFIKLVGQEQS